MLTPPTVVCIEMCLVPHKPLMLSVSPHVKSLFYLLIIVAYVLYKVRLGMILGI